MPRRLRSMSARRRVVYLTATALVLLLTAAGQMPVPQLKLVSIVHRELNAREAITPSSIPRYDLTRNRLIYDQLEIHLAIQGGFDHDDHVFLINGLLNPDIQIPRGARLVIKLAAMHLPAAFLLAPNPPVPREILPTFPRQLSELPIRPRFGVAFASAPARQFTEKRFDVAIATYLAESPGTLYWSNGVSPLGCYGRIIVVP
ncbi:MAG TPA: hypothetical protein VN515_09670 [Terriglobales bacterium]|nr:hypothetical protein [Terriglobales bacterium]